jgi:hypothetical protein
MTFTTDKPVTLDDLLRRKYQPPLSRRQRYYLALILASSFLQLRDSSWLPCAAWRKRDISFLRDANNPAILLLDRPYVTRDFSITSTEATHCQLDGVSGIALLGIVLLELCFGTLIEEHPARKRCPLGDDRTRSFFDLLAAVEWLRDVVEEAGPDYSRATGWCLLGSRKAPGGDAWRHLLFENVVKPLESCHGYLNPGSGIPVASSDEAPTANRTTQVS